MSKKEDIKFGLSNEEKALPQITTFLNTELKKDPNPYAIHDWWNETKTIFVELKSRRITHNQYDTAIIGLNKIKKCDNPNVNYYFVWLYTDGLFYLKYDKEVFDKFVIQKDYKIQYRFDVGKSEYSSVVHIPYKFLTKLPNTMILNSKK
jgi:hypothetical protein